MAGPMYTALLHITKANKHASGCANGSSSIVAYLPRQLSGVRGVKLTHGYVRKKTVEAADFVLVGLIGAKSSCVQRRELPLLGVLPISSEKSSELKSAGGADYVPVFYSHRNLSSLSLIVETLTGESIVLCDDEDEIVLRLLFYD